MEHISVLLNEVISKLNIKSDGIYIDATLGFGGHSFEILKKLKAGKLIVFEQDLEVLEITKQKLNEFKNVIYINKNFKDLKEELLKLNISKVDGILYDLGTSYYQLTKEHRGFTYNGFKVKLDMRMNQKDDTKTASYILNTYSVSDLINIFRKYGEEKKASLLANKIDSYRKQNKIIYNTQLNEIIRETKGYLKDKNPYKNIYQALRIEVNDEFSVLKDSLNQALTILNKDGKILVITFHSLEDKIVKDIFWKAKSDFVETPKEIIREFKTQKTVYPTKEEIILNNSSRSAKLRILIKI